MRALALAVLKVLGLDEVDTGAPPLVGERVCVIHVHSIATTVTRTDCGLRGADPFFIRVFTGRLRRPKRRIAGIELAGVVEAVGGAVTEFRENVLFLKELIEAGKYRAVIDRNLSAGAGGRGDQVRRDGAEDGKRRPKSRRRPRD